MNKILAWLTGDVFKAVGGVIDDIFTNDEERAEAKRRILQEMNSQAMEMERLKSEIIQTEAQGNWLQRSWRPIIMLAFGFIVVYSKFIAPAFSLPNAELETDFWDLLQLGIGGYVVGRSAEKIVKDVAQNITIKRNNDE